MKHLVAVTALLLCSSAVCAQEISQRGFIDLRGFGFFQTAPNDTVRSVGDALFREEVFAKPSPHFHFDAGIDVRANSYDHVADDWRLDFLDRGIRRPRFAVRRLVAGITAGKVTIEAGKQFIRWGRTDVLNPTDRFAPRDYLNVFDADLLPVLAARGTVQLGPESLDLVWAPEFTPSRLPLPTERWAAVQGDAARVFIVDRGSVIPDRSQQGVRWRHVGERVELALKFFDGFNHLPILDIRPVEGLVAVELRRVFARLRTYGGDVAIPTRWVTLKGEVESFTSPDGPDDYVLYVAEVERQVGEWVIVVGYAGDVSVNSGTSFRFSPDRGIARSIIGHVSYTVDPRRTVSLEGAARQNGDGFYFKAEYSQALGQHWRTTIAGVGLAGQPDDFLGQYRHNSHISIGLRFSF